MDFQSTQTFNLQCWTELLKENSSKENIQNEAQKEKIFFKKNSIRDKWNTVKSSNRVPKGQEEENGAVENLKTML